MSSSIRIARNFCLWQDLLGYGRPFRENNWKMEGEAIENLYRLRYIQEKVDIYEPHLEKVFALNDGVARILDIPSNNVHNIIGWLQYVINDFYLLNTEDTKRGYPGIRGVISFGERAELVDRDVITQAKYILTSPEKKKEYSKKPVIYTPKQLQMNTAFSKAYLIEESGSKMNVSGSNLFIDESVLEYLEYIINEVRYDRFGLINDDTYPDKDFIQYDYVAKFIRNGKQSEFNVFAQVNKTEIKWDYFSLLFSDVVPYNNVERNIATNLYIPYSLTSSLHGPSEDNLSQWCVNDIHERPTIIMSLSDGIEFDDE